MITAILIDRKGFKKSVDIPEQWPNLFIAVYPEFHFTGKAEEFIGMAQRNIIRFRLEDSDETLGVKVATYKEAQYL